jgi:DNA-binding protein HU-beta
VNKAQLVEALSARLGEEKKRTAATIEALLDTVYRTVQKGEKVAITGFGVFEKRDRAARIARNPATGEKVRVKKTSVPAFRAGQEFKNVVNGTKKLPKVAPAAKATTAKSTATKAPARKSSAATTLATKSPSAPAAKKTAAAKSLASKAPAKKAAKTTTAKSTATKTPARKSSAATTLATKSPSVPAAKKTAAAKSLASKAPAKKAAKSSARKTTRS